MSEFKPPPLFDKALKLTATVIIAFIPKFWYPRLLQKVVGGLIRTRSNRLIAVL